jgi:hypothetical protein
MAILTIRDSKLDVHHDGRAVSATSTGRTAINTVNRTAVGSSVPDLNQVSATYRRTISR